MCEALVILGPTASGKSALALALRRAGHLPAPFDRYLRPRPKLQCRELPRRLYPLGSGNQSAR